MTADFIRSAMHRFPHEGQPDALFIRRGSDQPLSPDVCRNESQADRSGYYTNRQLRFGNQESHRKSDENTMLCGHPAASAVIPATSTIICSALKVDL
ncbi:hypothetical protein RB195_013913 [Necator americanus]|uniref:Uncharacterized protein n=1 Tax=Necator americanus TaxID=51031 RepID=A0ABR1DY55_NECAM